MLRNPVLGLRWVALLALSCLLWQSSVCSQVVINEFTFQPLDGQDYVELYNAGSTSVNIGNWIIGSRDGYALNATLHGPQYAINPGTVLAPGDYFLLGLSGVPKVDQVVAGTGVNGRLWEDRNETIEIVDAGGTVRDAFYTDVNERSQQPHHRALGFRRMCRPSPEGGGTTISSSSGRPELP